MHNVKWTVTAKDQYDRLKANAKTRRTAREKKNIKKSSQDEGLFKQVAKTLALLRTNPRHPGLNTHEYDSIENPFDKKKKVFEAYVQNKTPGAYRVFWCYGPDSKELTIIAITPHP
ncbi:hypothetical protein Pla110_42180 [Polystyrenella longa]|uniref:Uncharacterized protein n=1 Tax=Polystyrenella longa TaxID=2528007 RepID=A0A518CTA3_9PLAN|nr:hypothetical protein [Polystyrenella longa]QDU82461.1 hypothetical protein Pla110_42180 [Polystyrenella longa]